MGDEGHDGTGPGTDRSARRRIFFVLQVALGLSLLGVLLWTADARRLWELVGSARKGWLLVSLLWALSVHVSRAAMLCWLVRGRGFLLVGQRGSCHAGSHGRAGGAGCYEGTLQEAAPTESTGT